MTETDNIQKIFDKPIFIFPTLADKNILKLFIVSVNWGEKKLNRPVCAKKSPLNTWNYNTNILWLQFHIIVPC